MGTTSSDHISTMRITTVDLLVGGNLRSPIYIIFLVSANHPFEFPIHKSLIHRKIRPTETQNYLL